MAQTQELKFDKNVLTWALLNHKLRGWLRYFNDLAEGKVDKDDIHTDFALQARIKDLTQRGNDNDGILAHYQYELNNNPNGEFATEFRKYWEFAKYIFMPEYHQEYINNYQLIVNKIGIFNEDVQLVILRQLLYKLQNQGQGALLEIINTKIANNKNASTQDKVDAAYGLLHKNHDIVRDVIELLKQDLDKEMKSEFTNPDKIKEICNSANGLMIRLQESFRDNDPHMNKIQNSLSKDYIKTIRNEFNIDNILAVGAEYIPQINQSLEERAVDAERQAHESDKKARRYEETNMAYNKLKMGYNDVSRRLEEEKAKNERLTGELNLLNKQVEQQSSFIKSVKMKIATMKTGLLAGNGVKDLQQFINASHQM